MDIYKALFYLTAGSFAFMGLTFVLRQVSLRQRGGVKKETSIRPWVGLEELEIVQIIDETPDIKSFRFKRIDGELFPEFKPGQFLSFQIKEDKKTSRSYSLSSIPQNKGILQVSIKKIDGGVGSSWFHGLKIGDRVKAFSPSGHFVENQESGAESVYIAGGVGITPILSMILSNLESAVSRKMVLFYGARTESDLAFGKLLDFYASRDERFSYYPILSQTKDGEGDKGYLTMEYIQSKIQISEDQNFYICGPAVMTEKMMDQFEQLNIPEDNIFMEQFVSPATIDESQIPERSVTVTWQGESFSYKGRENLLAFLESQNQFIPYACRAGVCGSCKCRITGKYKSFSNSGLTKTEQKQGLALACVCYPEEDVKVELT